MELHFARNRHKWRHESCDDHRLSYENSGVFLVTRNKNTQRGVHIGWNNTLQENDINDAKKDVMTIECHMKTEVYFFLRPTRTQSASFLLDGITHR